MASRLCTICISFTIHNSYCSLHISTSCSIMKYKIVNTFISTMSIKTWHLNDERGQLFSINYSLIHAFFPENSPYSINSIMHIHIPYNHISNSHYHSSFGSDAVLILWHLLCYINMTNRLKYYIYVRELLYIGASSYHHSRGAYISHFAKCVHSLSCEELRVVECAHCLVEITKCYQSFISSCNQK